ncbi:MAG: OmpA family protein [Thermodesulfobacteriota bacterium]
MFKQFASMSATIKRKTCSEIPSLWGRHALLLLCILPLISLSACVSKQTYDQQLQQSEALSSEVAEKESSIAELKDDLSTTRTQLADCRSELEQKTLEFESEKERLNSIYSARQERTARTMDELEQDIEELQKEKMALLEKVDSLEAETTHLEKEIEREQIAREARLAKVSNTYNELVDNLEQELERGELTIKQLKNKLSVNMVGQILFASGTADLTEDGKRVLKQVGTSLKKIADKRICVEGHTDNVPIKPGLHEIFPSNWELSARRSANVVHFLQDEVGIRGERLEIRAMGPYQPVADNSTPEGRAQNRRIEIVLTEME